MRSSRERSWLSVLHGMMPGLALMTLLAGLAACAPFGVAPAPPSSALATATAAANATRLAGRSAGVSGTPAANLPTLTPDVGWVAVVQIPDGSALGGPSVIGSSGGGSIASSTMTLGHFTLSSAAQVTIIFGCASPAPVQATVEIGVEGQSATVTCVHSGGSMNRFQTAFAASDVGRTLGVTATISTDGPTPQWYALVEQPK